MLLILLSLPFFGAASVQLAARGLRYQLTYLTLAAPLLGLVYLISQASQVFAGQKLVFYLPWIETLGLNLSLRLDGLSFLFALLILGIGFLVIIYAHYYLAAKEKAAKFYTFLLLFMGAMLGVVLASNLLLMVFFWELTSLASFLLISFWYHRPDARAGARMALAVTGGGGLALLAGVILLGKVVGSYELEQVLTAGEQVKNHALYLPILLLILLGVFTKSAQFPFHFWLPNAMAAPTPVSAYLHSATLVKAGVFLLARFYPVLSGTEAWFYLVTFTGLATLLVGAITALFQHDLKGLLAYSTVSHLGLITMLFGLGSDLAPVAAIFHIINHATFKASLFMAAGIIDHETGTRDMRKLNGLWKYMPHTALLAMVASSAMAGVPLLNGFLSKEMFFAETLHQQLLGSFSFLIPALATFAAVFSVAYSLRFIHDVFFTGDPIDVPIYPPKEPPRYMKIPVEILVFLCLLVGMLPGFSVAGLLASASAASLGKALPEYSLTIWHGINLPLVMSSLAMLGGILLYFLRKPLFDWYEGLPTLSAMQTLNKLIVKAKHLAARALARLQAPSLQRFAAIFFISLAVLVIWKLLPMSQFNGNLPLSPADPITLIGLASMSLMAVLTVVYHRQRLLSLIMLSLVGLVVVMLFARFSAPDLALTQLVVEAVTILLMLLVLNYLPATTPAESSSLRRLRDFCLALTTGSLFAVLAYAVLTRPFDTISGFYLDNSLEGGGGTNVVNVILVDFRGFDTLGEISVLAITALAISALMQGLHITSKNLSGRHEENPAEASVYWSRDGNNLMLKKLSRLMLPLALLVAVFIFLRGHNQPGGGFIAGLVTAVALVLLQVSSGQDWVKHRLKINYQALSSLGVLIAGFTGLASWLFAQPFLTTAHGQVQLPVIGALEVGSALVFDLGVYFTVVGATLLILTKLGRLGHEAAVQAATQAAADKEQD